ncbi:hypothetical protein GJ744_004098 [Endocarpon pusillum]|uniref:Uncharacterized protein n=1 Tax=Endocarpon pusillum TaxID=364733 RepID=A0A8H7E7Q9_9EURO|nr:hypothetical protein GJ744_004098 [Endocarpon pusillum]
MLTVGEASGLIAAAVMLVQYALPAILVVILIKYVGTENNAVTWSVVNRIISNTLWPHLLRADAVSIRRVPWPTNILGCVSTIAAALLVLSSVLAPLGLGEMVMPSKPDLVEFEYVKDPGPWGRVTMPRPAFKFSRLCESGRTINCPGQYQGVDFNETSPGMLQSVETDSTSTVNLTIPRNITTMFTSATSDRGNTVSGLFDIQYRRWKITRWGVYDKGQPYVGGASRHIESLIAQEGILLKEGLIVDMRESPGIGFRNHTVPMGLEYGGTWSEDITWIEPVTQCADTNLSIELRTNDNVNDLSANRTFFIVDRGAFLDLNDTALESPPWNDNQTLDLFGRAYKAARMHNVIVASALNISLPLIPPTTTVSRFMVKETAAGTAFFGPDFETIALGGLSDIVDPTEEVSGPSPDNSSVPTGNMSRPERPHYSDGVVKLVALNFSAITQICRGFYEVSDVELDTRANNITYPAVNCGTVLGAPVQSSQDNLTASGYSGVETYQKNLYVCASGVRASIKTVDFRYNGTGGRFSNLNVLTISDKKYANEASKPLWAAEHSFDKRMHFEPLWGLVDNSYENITDGFYALRAEKLWLPTSPFMTINFGETEGYDALAAVSGFGRRLSNLYGGISLGQRDYSGKFEYTLFERFQRVSHNQTVASQIPSLILNDGLAAGLVGTKTSISSRMVQWPASLAVDNTARGFPQVRVMTYRRVITYDIRFAIPGFVVLALLLFALVYALAICLFSHHSIISTMKHMYNQTGPGRLATNLLRPGQGDAKEPSRDWVNGYGRTVLSFGHIGPSEKEYYCAIVGKEGVHEADVHNALLAETTGERNDTPTR